MPVPQTGLSAMFAPQGGFPGPRYPNTGVNGGRFPPPGGSMGGGRLPGGGGFPPMRPRDRFPMAGMDQGGGMDAPFDPWQTSREMAGGMSGGFGGGFDGGWGGGQMGGMEPPPGFDVEGRPTKYPQTDQALPGRGGDFGSFGDTVSGGNGSPLGAAPWSQRPADSMGMGFGGGGGRDMQRRRGARGGLMGMFT